MAVVIMYEPGMRRIDRLALDMAHEGSKEIAADIRKNIRSGGHVVTGALVRSVYVRKLAKSSRVYIGTDHWYFIEYGVEAHVITVKYKRVLSRNVRGTVYGKKADHPGHRAFRPVRRAFYQKRPTLAHKLTIAE
jgi:hypothetical protein